MRAAAYGAGAKLPAPTNAVRMAAYRSGSALADQKTGHSYDFTRKGDEVLHSEIMAPAGVPAWVQDRTALWNEVEKIEKRKDAQLFREVLVTLPRELSREQCVALMQRFVGEQFVSRGMVADWSIHRPDAADGEAQPHAHVMLSLRHIGPEGFGKKAREWNDIGWQRKVGGELSPLQTWREAWERGCNAALEDAGSAARVDHRTLKAQRADALAKAERAHDAGWHPEAAQLSHLARTLDRRPQRPRGLSATVEAATAQVRQRWERWERIARRKRALAASYTARLGGELHGMLHRVEEFLYGRELAPAITPAHEAGREITYEYHGTLDRDRGHDHER